jgi:hypothetical protein
VLISSLDIYSSSSPTSANQAPHKRPRLTHSAQPLRAASRPTLLTFGTYLPALEVYLADSWASPDAVSDDDAKADGALVPTHIWDNRITLVLPHTRGALTVMRKHLFRKWCSRIYRSFIAYSRRTYGDSWQQQALDNKGSLIRSARKRRQGGEDVIGRREVQGRSLEAGFGVISTSEDLQFLGEVWSYRQEGVELRQSTSNSLHANLASCCMKYCSTTVESLSLLDESLMRNSE